MRKILIFIGLFLVIGLFLIIFISGFGAPPPPSRPEGLYVKKVLEGDLIELSNGEIVRYIGIDAPKYISPENAEYYGEDAYYINRNLVAGKVVRLEFDVQERDEQGRLLAYVFLEDPVFGGEIFVNAYLLENGYAVVAADPFNVRYENVFSAKEETARRMRRGLWEPAQKGFKIGFTGVSRRSFNPKIEGVNYLNYVDIAFGASHYVNWVFQVIDGNQKVLKEIRVNRSKSGEIRWFGDDNGGNALPEGKYILRIVGIDNDGNQAQDTRPIIIDTTKPGFKDEPRLSREVITSKDEFARLTFSPNEAVSAVVLAVDKTGKLRVRGGSVLGSLDLESGKKATVTWDDFTALPNDEYNFKIEMIDNAGNYAEYFIPIMIVIPDNPVKEGRFDYYN
jgi:micrococcal nuclease